MLAVGPQVQLRVHRPTVFHHLTTPTHPDWLEALDPVSFELLRDKEMESFTWCYHLGCVVGNGSRHWFFLAEAVDFATLLR